MFAGRLQVQNRHSSDFLKRYVNEIYQFFDNLRIKYENISVCLISSMSKADIGEISKTNVIKNRDIFLNSIKESGDVQYSLDYAYGMVFSEGKNKYTLSRFDEEGKAKKYMRLITIKGSRLGEKTKDQVYTFDTETHSYCLKHSFELTTTTTTEQNNGGFKI
jgi:hypothetical protein